MEKKLFKSKLISTALKFVVLQRWCNTMHSGINQCTATFKFVIPVTSLPACTCTYQQFCRRIKLFAAAAQKLHPELSLPNVSSVSLSAEEKGVTACCEGNVQALHAVIQAGVSINHSSGNSNSTLLHMAAYCGQVKISLLRMYRPVPN